METYKKPKVVVVHPQKQGSYVLSSSLFRSHFLKSFITSFYFKPFSIASFLHFFAPKKYKQRIENSRILDIPNNSVKLYSQITSLFVKHSYKNHSFEKRIKINDKFNKTFGKKAAHYCISNGVDIVFSSVKNSYELFHRIKSKNNKCKTVLEFSSNAPRYALSIFQKDISLFPESTLSSEINGEYFGNEEEYDLADYYLCPSNITAKGIEEITGKKDKIQVIHRYYMNNNYSFQKRLVTTKKLKIVYVGSVTAMKGIHHLCNIAASIKEDADIYLIGDYNESFFEKYYSRNIENVHLLGRLNQKQINDFFKECDLFVFPSLADAIGMSVLEAMFSGLPALCSIYAGASDYIIDGINGFLFDPMDENGFKNKIIDISKRYRKDLPTIGEKAHETILNSNKEKYDKEINDFINKILNT